MYPQTVSIQRETSWNMMWFWKFWVIFIYFHTLHFEWFRIPLFWIQYIKYAPFQYIKHCRLNMVLWSCCNFIKLTFSNSLQVSQLHNITPQIIYNYKLCIFNVIGELSQSYRFLIFFCNKLNQLFYAFLLAMSVIFCVFQHVAKQPNRKISSRQDISLVNSVYFSSLGVLQRVDEW